MEIRTALITGATDGIGKAVAHRLKKSGWKVVLVGRNRERTEGVVGALNADPGGNPASFYLGDLAVMADIQSIARRFQADHPRLDFLFLNANHITHEPKVGDEGFESNLAVGHMGRALLSFLLEPTLRATPGSHILSTVGLNLSRCDLGAPGAASEFVGGMASLGRWQWANQVFARAWNEKHPIPMNHWMPGIVKTKILADEPGIMGYLIPVVVALFAVSVEKSAEHLETALGEICKSVPKNAYFNQARNKGIRKLPLEPGDADKVYRITREWLGKYL